MPRTNSAHKSGHCIFSNTQLFKIFFPMIPTTYHTKEVHEKQKSKRSFTQCKKPVTSRCPTTYHLRILVYSLKPSLGVLSAIIHQRLESPLLCKETKQSLTIRHKNQQWCSLQVPLGYRNKITICNTKVSISCKASLGDIKLVFNTPTTTFPKPSTPFQIYNY